jgi:hypothetical protein
VKVKYYLRKLGGLVLAAVLLPGIVTLLSTTNVEAQRRGRVVIVGPRFVHPWWGWGYGPYWGYGYGPYYYSRYGHYVFYNADAATNEGYHDGLKTGQGDAKHNRSYNPERSHYFQEAGFGNFSEAYRSGFMHGYADGFRS